MWIFGQTLWTDVDQTFTISTLLLMRHNANAGCGVLATHEAPPATAVIIGLNGEDVSGQSTDKTMRRCVMLLCVLDGEVMRWHPVADWPSVGAL